MANFPTSSPSFAGFTSSHTLSADNHAAQHNLEQGEIVAVAGKIGTGSSTPASAKLLRGTGSGTSSWAQADLTTDVTGTLPQANGGTGTTSATGSGATVYQTSPTLTTPTIADFTNATHTHASNAQGGQLNGANAITDGTITPAELASGTGATWASAAFTPTIGSVAGTITTSSATGKYIQIGKTVIADMAITITTNGTGAGAVTATLPVTALSAVRVLGFGRADVVSGKALQVRGETTTKIDIYDATGTYPGADTEVLRVTVIYEPA